MSKKLSKLYKKKLFLKSKYILKTAFFYIKKYALEINEKKIKNIIVVPKKCGDAVKRNYLRRITRVLLTEYQAFFNHETVYIIVYQKTKLNDLYYKDLNKIYLDFINK